MRAIMSTVGRAATGGGAGRRVAGRMPVRRVDLTDYSLDLDRALGDAAEAVAAGKLVVLPTETVYGVAARPDVAAAGEALASLRGGATGPLVPHLADPADLERYVPEPGEAGRTLARKLWPGPVALVFTVDPASAGERATALGVDRPVLYGEEGRITLRCPDDPICRMVLGRAGRPTVVTRAGLPGDRPNAPPEVALLEGLPIDQVLDAGPTRYERPSTVVRVSPDGSSWDVVREGIYDRRTIERALRTTLLFVCSGNTCRSPMAMAAGRQALADGLGTTPDRLGEAGFDVISSGVYAMPGMRATAAAAEAVADVGGGLASHRSRPLDVGTIHRSDLIVAMSREHRDAVVAQVPSAADKTVMLDPAGDVDDPIGSDAAHYKSLSERIRTLVDARLAETLLKR